jgi:hypothetical protein
MLAMCKRPPRALSFEVSAKKLETGDSVQQHFGGARIRLQPAGDGLRRSAVPHGGEQIQFERGQHDAARPVAPNEIVEILRQNSHLLAGALCRSDVFTVFERLSLHRSRVGPLQAGHHFAGPQMRGDNLGHIFGRHPAIPNPIGINDDHRSVIAQPEAAARSDLNLILQPC